ncbi:tetratricopeptide repeat protein, partial [Nocardiopsis sp. NPDC055879]
MNASYEGHHNDYRGSVFNGPFINEQHLQLPPHEINWPIRIGVIPEEAVHYQHRAIAEQLEQALDGFGTVVLRQVLSGTGGVGKTQLVAHHARTLRAITDPDHRVDVLVWANAATRTGITSAYSHAARQLYSNVPDDPEDAAAFFLAWLGDPNKHQGRRWLVIWDDLADPAPVTDLWPPHDQPHGRTLVTTRRRDHSLTTQGRHLIDVDVYTVHEARAFLANALDEAGIDHTDTDLGTLAESLGRLPLALGQAVPYMAELGMSCDEYLQVFHDRMSTLREVFPDWDTDTPLAATWDLSLTMADTFTPQGLARPLMGLVALLDGEGLPSAVLHAPSARDYLATRAPKAALNGATISVHQVRTALAGLHRLNLITRPSAGSDIGANGAFVRVHQLVQRATREHPATHPTPESVHATADALHHTWNNIDRDPDLAQRLRANTTALRSHPNVQGRSSEEWLWEPDGHPVLFHAGRSLGESGQFKDAVVYWEDLTRTAEHHFGPSHLNTLTTRGSLAHWQGRAGDPTGAVTSLEQLLPDCIRVLGPDHRATFTTRHNLAHWQGEAGNPASAVATIFGNLIPEEQRVLGPDHPDILTTRGSLAHWQGRAGDPTGAVTSLEQLLTDQQRVLGPDHPNILTTRSSLALWQGKAGNPAE